MRISNSTGGNSSDVDFENLYPAMIACFGNIALGYIAGRANLLSQTEAKGINTFIGYFSLPSLVFLNLVEMDVYSVNWKFLLAIFLAKLIIFLLVIIFYILLVKPVDTASAGILAIFSSQSNDFAIGYPIVTALYQTTHPDYARYIYLIAPINLAILNPIAFALIELASNNSNAIMEPRSRCNKLKRLVKVFLNVISNPVVFMTILGIICNFIFHQKVPAYMKGIMEVLGGAFSACALFILGLRMVGKIGNLSAVGFLLPGLLIFGKLLALPEIIRQLSLLFNVGGDSKATTDMSTFGFLYGTFPSAPTVFVFACNYGVQMDLIATAMVACTFLSAPLIFVSAKLISIKDIDPSDYINEINLFTLEVSIIGLVASLWLLFVFVLTKKINKIPHKFTACLLISQIFSCVGAILYNYTDDKGWVSYVQFCLFTGGIYSSRIWTAVIAITLLFMENRSLCFILFKVQPYFMIFGWGLPTLITILLVIFDRNEANKSTNNPYFEYGVFQAIVAVSLLVLCFVVTLGSLILHHMYKKRHENYWRIGNDNCIIDSSDTAPICPTTSAIPDCSTSINCGSANCCSIVCPLPTINETAEDSPNPRVVDIEDLFGNSTRNSNHVSTSHDVGENGEMCPSGFNCKDSQDYCQGIIRQYEEPINEDLELIEEERSSHDPQVMKHCVLLILLLFSMFFGLTVSIWTLIMEKMTAIYIELSFLDVSFNIGQSIIILAVFFTDTKEILLPLLKRWRMLLHKENKLILPMESELSHETLHICEQFKKHHLDNCRKDIQTSRRWRLKVYENVFSGKKLVDWLIEVGLARDRIEAINYARHLLEGRVLRHINEIYHFYDKNLLYTFN